MTRYISWKYELKKKKFSFLKSGIMEVIDSAI